MLYLVQYTRRNKRNSGEKWVNHVADATEAVRAFYDWFFRENSTDGVKIDRVLGVEFTGDLSTIDVIDAALERKG